MTVQLLVSVNGGAPTSGAITVPSGATLDFTFADTDGWDNYRLELHGPPNWTVPGAWTDEGESLAVYTGVTTPPAQITLPANTVAWGKWMPRLIVNGGMVAGKFAPHLVDYATGLKMLSTNGLEDIGILEDVQFHGAYASWCRSLQNSLRIIDSAFTFGGPPTGVAAGALRGTYPNPEINKINVPAGSDASYDTWYRHTDGTVRRTPNGLTGQVLRATTSAAPSWSNVWETLLDCDYTALANQSLSVVDTTANTIVGGGVSQVWRTCTGCAATYSAIAIVNGTGLRLTSNANGTGQFVLQMNQTFADLELYEGELDLWCKFALTPQASGLNTLAWRTGVVKHDGTYAIVRHYLAFDNTSKLQTGITGQAPNRADALRSDNSHRIARMVPRQSGTTIYTGDYATGWPTVTPHMRNMKARGHLLFPMDCSVSTAGADANTYQHMYAPTPNDEPIVTDGDNYPSLSLSARGASGLVLTLERLLIRRRR